MFFIFKMSGEGWVVLCYVCEEELLLILLKPRVGPMPAFQGGLITSLS